MLLFDGQSERLSFLVVLLTFIIGKEHTNVT